MQIVALEDADRLLDMQKNFGKKNIYMCLFLIN